MRCEEKQVLATLLNRNVMPSLFFPLSMSAGIMAVAGGATREYMIEDVFSMAEQQNR